MRRVRTLITICVALGIALASDSIADGRLYSAYAGSALSARSTGKPGPGMFLVATRALADPNFGQTVVYLVEHNDDGTMGLIVNRPSEIRLSEAIPDIEDGQAGEHTLYYGGPVGMASIFMLARSDSASNGLVHVADDVYIGSNRSALDRMLAAKKTARELRFYLGHSGWAAGQLDFELVRGSWHVVTAGTDAIFAHTDSLWERLIERLEPYGIQARANAPATRLSIPRCCVNQP